MSQEANAPDSADAAGNDEFVNFIAEGLAYVNEVREVKPKRSKGSFTAVRLAAMHGKKGELEYTKLDLTCRGRHACELMQLHADAINAKGKDGKRINKVVAYFRAGDLYTGAWLYEGKPYACMKGRLLLITYLSINGEVVYREEGGAESDRCDSPLPGELDPLDEQGGDAPEVADVVELSKEDPEFDARRAQLKGGGYRFFKQFQHDGADFENVWVKFAA